MGFGRVANATQLGQPLDFSAVVKLDPDEALARECVFADVVAGDNRVPASLVRVSVAGVQGDAERLVRVSTSTPIDEPVVTVNVTLGCTSRVTRQFVAFVDPPGLALAPLASSASVVAAPAVPAAVEAPRGRDRRVADVAVPRREAASQAASGRVAPPADLARRPTRLASVRAASAPTGPRLQLDAPTLAVAAGPTAAASMASAPVPAAPPVTVVAAASAASEQDAALARERLRIQSLEDEMGRLRAESKAQQQVLAQLQLQVGATRSQRYANPLVYTLAALCLLLTTVVCGLLGRRARDRAAARWLTSTLLARSDAAAAAAVGVAATAVGSAMGPAAGSAVGPTVDRAAVATVEAAPPVPRPAQTAPAVRASSVEELIDLEQQADFFVVLGQDDAAVDLLNRHVESDAGVSPVPLLKLLEIHKRTGDQAEYDRIRARVDARFNARTPAFDADFGRGRTLADHPGVVARLQSLWPVPVSARDALHALVFRSAPSDESFDLPAFRELLLLHSIATDHVDRSRAAFEPRSTAGGPPAAADRPLDVDLTATPKRPATSAAPVPGKRLPVLTAAASQFDNFETVPSALRRPPDYANESSFVDLELEFPGLAPAPTLPR